MPQESIDLIELGRTAWRGRWRIVAVTAVFVAAGAAYAVLATPWFRAETLLMPAEEQRTGGLLTELGGLAGLAGVSVGVSDSAEPIAVLQSQGFTKQFIEEESLIEVLLKDEWDAEAGRWKEADPAAQPDWRDAVKYFDEEVRTVSEDARTGLITLGIRWTDPVVAADWANKLVKRLNDRMREQALLEADANLKYLQTQLETTSVVSVQQAVGRLLESEMQKAMLARGKQEFALRIIDRAEAPREPFKPRRLIVVLLSAVAGGLLSVLYVLVRQAVRNRVA